MLGKSSPQGVTPLLAQALDSTSNVQLNTNIINLGKDSNNALILSDAPAPLPISGGSGATIIVDTQGYQTLNITTQGLAANVTCSNDKITWSSLSGAPLVFGALGTAVAAHTGYTFPCIARYIRFILSATGSATIFLRNSPWIGTYNTTAPTVPSGTATNNISQIGGTATVTAGVGGTLAVGGNIAVGSAQTTNPLVIGGIDTSNLTRRLQTDSSGRLIISSIDQSNTTRNLGSISPTNTMQNIPALAVQDLAQFEGQSISDLLNQVLIELKILNYYNFTLLTTGTINVSDEPTVLRNDPVISTVFG